MSRTRWLNEREQSAWRAYLAMNARLAAALHRRLQADPRLSLAEFAVLVSLTDRPDARARAFELAEDLQWERSRLSHQLTRMRRRGTIVREECPQDARGSVIVLTSAGRQAIEAAAPGHVQAVRELVFDQLDADQVDSLRDIAERVLAGLNGGK
jgi:DNA-binding MarR family transcriptional regulator